MITLLAFVKCIMIPDRAMAQTSIPDFDAIDKFVQKEMDAIKIPGLALSIVHGNQIVHQKGFGIAAPTGRPVTPQTSFNIASASETFTALAILQLVEAGKIELDTPVQKYLPWFQVADAGASAQITVYDLLNHTSGIPEAAGNDYPEKDDKSDSALEKRVRMLNTVQLDRTVGNRYEYSNANYDTLGLIVQVVSGLPYEKYVQQNIFAPLKMHNSFTSRAEAQIHEPATGYRIWFGFPFSYDEIVPRPHLPSGYQFSSAEDIAHLLIAYLNGGVYQGVSVLSEAGIQKMRNSAVSSGPGCATYSMHWSHSSLCNSSALGLGGDTANFKARILVLPDEKLAVVVLMNTQVYAVNGPRQDRIDDGVIALLLGKTPTRLAPHNIQILAGMILIGVVTVILFVQMIRSIARSMRRSTDHSDNFPKMGRDIVFPLALDILWVLMLTGMIAVAVGNRSNYPFHFILENVPDLGWMTISSAVIALSWGFARTILTSIRLRRN